ncbi:MAG: GNAT family N-acetyltransferase [Dehalogenimonas sp.]
MTTQVDGLARLNKKDLDQAADVLARAFTDYELLKYYYPDEAQRWKFARTFGLIAISVCLKYGEVYTVSKEFEGISAWLPPGKAPFNSWQMIRSVSPSVIMDFGRLGAKKMQAYNSFADDMHRQLAPYPHWYLQILGIDPAWQGKGMSRRLVRPLLERFDLENLPCYLETNTEKNVAIYQRFGFEVLSEGVVPGTKLKLFSMLRKPEFVKMKQEDRDEAIRI